VKNLFNRHRKTGGFTLIEMLITIGIMLFLFALVAVAAGRMREKARISKTKSLIKRIAVALEGYHALNHNYPTIPIAGDPNPDTCPYSAATPLASAGLAFWQGIDLKREFVLGSSLDDFSNDDFDSTGQYFADAWGNRLKYRKIGPERYLVWSFGSKQGNVACPHPAATSTSFNDDIGTGDYWDAPSKSWMNCGNFTRERDSFVDLTGVEHTGANITSHDTDF
jgi:prepilin-type N-terminal cleavage/methylation domain-containing protein